MHQYSLYLWTCQVKAELIASPCFLLGPHLRSGATTKCLLMGNHGGSVNYIWCRAARDVSEALALFHSPLQRWSRRALPMLCSLIPVFFSSISSPLLDAPRPLRKSPPPLPCTTVLPTISTPLQRMLEQVHQSKGRTFKDLTCVLSAPDSEPASAGQ